MTTVDKEIVQADVIIVGAGPGGLTAALYASRANLETIIIEKGMPGGEINNTADVENYPGFKLISGPELANHIFESAMAFGAEHIYGDVEKIEIDALTKKNPHQQNNLSSASRYCCDGS